VVAVASGNLVHCLAARRTEARDEPAVAGLGPVCSAWRGSSEVETSAVDYGGGIANLHMWHTAGRAFPQWRRDAGLPSDGDSLTQVVPYGVPRD